jgi:tetratricopeptide (TPR) repeat protein
MKSLEEVLDERRRERIVDGLRMMDQDQFRAFIVDLMENLGLEVTASMVSDEAIRIEAKGEDGPYLVTASQRREHSTVEYLNKIREKADFVERLPVLLVTHEMEESTVHFAEDRDISVADLSKLLLLISKFNMEDRVLSDLDRHILEEEGTRFLPSVGRYDSLVREAERDLKEGRSVEALRKLDRAIELKSNQDSVWRMRARALLAMGDGEGAVVACGKATELDPGNPTNWYLLALIHHELGDLAEEVEDYTAALRANPRHLPSLINRGATLFELGRLEDSLKAYNRMVELFPKDPRGFNNRAMVRRELGELDLALVDVERALSMDADNREALVNRARLMVDSGDPRRAMDAWREILATDRGQPRIWMELGDVQMEEGLFEEAARSFSVALSLDPDLEGAEKRRDEAMEAAGILEGQESKDLAICQRFMDASLLLRSMGDLEGALEEIDKVLELEPSHPQALLERGQLLLESGNFEESLASVSESSARATSPQSVLDLEALLHRMGRLGECSRVLEDIGTPESVTRRCLLLLERGEPERINGCMDAIVQNDLTRAISMIGALCSADPEGVVVLVNDLMERYPTSPWLMSCRGVALRDLGRLDEAEDWLRKAVEAEPKYADGWNNLGSVLYLGGEFKDAERCFDQALLVRRMPLYLNNMGACRLALDDVQGASESYLSSLKMEQSPETINGMGMVAERGKELVRAMEFYQEALEREPNFKDARMNLKRVSDLLEK